MEGSISGNYTNGLNANGGGVYAGGAFTMEGGTISGNHVDGGGTSLGGGVFATGSSAFSMKGDAEIVSSGISGAAALNGVYLGNRKITITGNLNKEVVANIVYPINVGASVLFTNANLTAGNPPNHTRFHVNGASGKIDASGSITS
jgi:hypothetical protein